MKLVNLFSHPNAFSSSATVEQDIWCSWWIVCLKTLSDQNEIVREPNWGFGCVFWYMLTIGLQHLILAHHRKVKKKVSLNMLSHFSDFAPIQIHNHAYDLVGIYFEKTGYKHKWHKLYFTQQQRTNNNVPVFKCVLHKIVVRYCILQILQVTEFLDFFAIWNECLFYSVQER
jgi:hypothetical protein